VVEAPSSALTAARARACAQATACSHKHLTHSLAHDMRPHTHLHEALIDHRQVGGGPFGGRAGGEAPWRQGARHEARAVAALAARRCAAAAVTSSTAYSCMTPAAAAAGRVGGCDRQVTFESRWWRAESGSGWRSARQRGPSNAQCLAARPSRTRCNHPSRPISAVIRGWIPPGCRERCSAHLCKSVLVGFN